MPLRNRPEGYGVVSKTLHWATVAAVLVQFVVGYAMDWDDGGGGRGRGRGRGGESGRGRGRGGDDETGWALPDLSEEPLVAVHLLVGASVLFLGVARWAWRRLDSLPEWAPQLAERDKRIAHWTERVLLTMLVVVPVTGLLLLASGDDDLLWLHVAAQIALIVAIAAHLALVLGRRLVPRMLPGTG